MFGKKQQVSPGSMQGGTKVPVEQSILARAIEGVKYVMTGNKSNEWFGPSTPIQAQAQDKDGVKGRQFDFPVGVNLRRTTRDSEGTSFATMRALADSYDLLRLMIETRKDQMSKMRWTVGPKDPKGKADDRCKAIQELLAFPDGEHDWDTWLRMLLEDMLVIDAATVYPRQNLAGGLFSLEVVDGSTVKRVLAADGRTPQPPEVAYQQILKGVPAVDFNRDELIYRPRNVRSNRMYGYSPVEQIIMTVNIAIRRQVSQLQYYTEGNVPEALIGVPPEWNPDQIQQFQEYWDSMLEGNTAARRHAKFVAGGTNIHMTKEAVLTDKFDEWLARIVAYAFSVSPQALVAQMNRATAETADNQAKQEGLQPVMNWVKNLMDFVLWKYLDAKDLEFKWGKEKDIAPKDQALIHKTYVDAKIMHPDEVRDEMGLDPLSEDQKLDMTPPPPPGLGGDTMNPDDPGPPGKGKPPAKAKEGSTEKPVGKHQSSGLRKVKAISRDRATVQASISAIIKLVKPALTAARKNIQKQLKSSGEFSKAMTSSDQAAKLIAQLTFDELKDLAPDLAEILEEMAGDGGAAALAQVMTDFGADQLKQVNQRALEYAEERAAELVTQLEESTRDMLRATITEGLEQGWSNDDLASAMEDMYGFSEARAETIARTETAYADVQGNLEGYKASGVVGGKQWIISQDEICDECVELDGVIVDLEDDFPGDGGDGPPLHPNCRCDIVPVLIEEEET